MMQPQPPQQVAQPQMVLIQQPGSWRVWHNYASETAKSLGITQIVIGVLCIIIGIIAFFTDYWYYSINIAAGIWCGVFYIITGAFGVASSKFKTSCYIYSFMVMSIVAVSVFVLPILIVASLNIAPHWRYTSTRIPDVLLLIMCLGELGVGIASSVICCRAVCCGQQINQNGVHPMVTYPTAQPQVVFMQSQGQVAPPQYVASSQFVATEQQVASPQYVAPPQYVDSSQFVATQQQVASPQQVAPPQYVGSPQYVAPLQPLASPQYVAPSQPVAFPQYVAPPQQVAMNSPQQVASPQPVTSPQQIQMADPAQVLEYGADAEQYGADNSQLIKES